VFRTRTNTALWSGSFWARVWTPALDAANDREACEKAGLTSLGKRPGNEKVTTTVDCMGT